MEHRRPQNDDPRYSRAAYRANEAPRRTSERDLHSLSARDPRTPRSLRESASAGRDASARRQRVSQGDAGRVRVSRDERSAASAPRGRNGQSARLRSSEQDSVYVGGRPSRFSQNRSADQRVSGWTSRRASGFSASRGMRRGLGGGSGFRFNPLLAVAAVLVVVLLVFAGTRIASCVSAAGGEDSPGDTPAEASDDGTSSGKLAGAIETVDENGIVHGTTPEGINYTVRGRGVAGAQADKVTLVAAGDQIGTDQVLELTDSYAGSIGDGAYDFMPFYQEVAPFIQSYDLRFINQETIMAGTEEYDYSGYPSFNTPSAAADAISQVGFNLVNFGTNHTLDYSTYGVEESHKVWDLYPELLVTGSYASQQERDTVHMIERNGITFALLGYCYGDNYLGTYENFPNSYHLAGFDKAAMETEIKRAQQVADVVIVAMHWGDEYTVELNDQQTEYAKFLADLDVDLVLGTHAHIMQKTAYVTGESGNTVPVVFGLSDFVSGWTKTNYILSGLFTCEFARAEDGSVSVGNLAWYPTIEWSDGGQVYVRFLKDMDEATTNANTRTEDVDGDYTYLREFIANVGMEIPVVL